MKPASFLALALIAIAGATPRPARAQTPAAPDTAAVDDLGLDETATPADSASPAPRPHRLEALVPEIGAHPYRLDAGPRPFEHRIAFSPGYGSLGSDKLFSFRIAFNPSPWLGYEGAIEHNPAQAVHAVLHSLSAIVRHPLAGRFQPYAVAGYGMVMVYPGRSLNAIPVTKNALTAGGGLEFYIRGDLALRGEVRRATVFGRERDRDGVVAFDYFEQTIGLAFYRTIRP